MVLALLALFFPACPSDGMTAYDPPLCVWDAQAEGVYTGGQSFIATPAQVVYLSPAP